jgi:hypothetical protein
MGVRVSSRGGVSATGFTGLFVMLIMGIVWVSMGAVIAALWLLKQLVVFVAFMIRRYTPGVQSWWHAKHGPPRLPRLIVGDGPLAPIRPTAESRLAQRWNR